MEFNWCINPLFQGGEELLPYLSVDLFLWVPVVVYHGDDLFFLMLMLLVLLFLLFLSQGWMDRVVFEALMNCFC